MKIYVVTSGDYSSYMIDAVFTDKAKAELFAEPYADRRVEEYDTDPKIPNYIEHGYKFYSVVMFEDGSLPTNKYSFDVYEWPNDRLVGGYTRLSIPEFNNYEYPHFHTGKKWPYPDPDKHHAGEMVMEINVKAHDKDHAIKIANEKRTQLIAMDRWGKNE